MNGPESQPVASKSKRHWHQYGLRTLLIVVASVALLIGLGSVTLRFLEKTAVRVHQESVTRSLATWAVDDSQIHSDREAFHSVDMLRYIEHYYVPGDGYHSDPATDAALQTQRKRTTAAIVEALERYTGERHGNDLQQWDNWRQRRQTQPPPKR